MKSTKEIIDKAKWANEEAATTIESEPEKQYRPIRVRYAPSPTGSMHIGGLRTALFNYLFAKRNNGKFLLRIEDTDKSREVPGSDKSIAKIMRWAGLTWDEGLGSTYHQNSTDGSMGPYGPYYQSQRLELYKKYVDALVERK